MVFFNESMIVKTSLDAISTNITGDIFLTLLFILIFIICFALAFRIPIEFTALIIFPLLIGFTAYYGMFMPVLGVAMLYLTVLIAKNLFFWK